MTGPPIICQEAIVTDENKISKSVDHQSLSATLSLPDGRVFELPLMKPTNGEEVICDVRNLYNSGKCLLYDPGFNSTASCASAITYVDGDKGMCLYRGYPVPDLATKRDFLDTCFLLLYGYLPGKSAREAFQTQVTSEMLIHNRLKDFVSTFVPGAHPMSVLASTIAAMASFYADPMAASHIENWEIRELACIRIVAKMPTIVAMSYKILMGQPMVYPRADLSFSENFLNMMFSTPVAHYTVDPLHAKIIDSFLIIHADHEQNASTTTVRTAGSSLANPYACIATGVTSLWGRAHGGANEAAIEMLKSIGTVDNVPSFIEKVKRKEARLMGFGHRVYRHYDPRAEIMQNLCEELFESKGCFDPLYLVAKELERHALADDYFKSRRLYPNVDFYSGIVMRGLGIPQEMFTCMFALGRTVGWLSHWKEMVEEGLIKIVRPRQLYLGRGRREVEEETSEQSEIEEHMFSKNRNVPFHVIQTEILRGQPNGFLPSSDGGLSFEKFAAVSETISQLVGVGKPQNEHRKKVFDDVMDVGCYNRVCGEQRAQQLLSPNRLDCRSPARLRDLRSDDGAHLIRRPTTTNEEDSK